MPERPNTAVFEQTEGIAKVAQYIEHVAAAYRAEHIPVGNDGRIDMAAYRNLYPDVDKDLARNSEWEKEWFQNIPPSEIPARRREREGEQLEMLAHAILVKNLPKEFLVVRASPHDDRANKVDTVILDRATGTLVCAFDEVGTTSGVDYEAKQQHVQEHNLKGGATLKYGMKMEEKNGKKEVMLSSVSNIPLFYIALPSDRIKKGVQEFLPGENQSDFEKNLFSYFMAAITLQIHGLELYEQRLNPDLKEKLTAFKKITASLGERKHA
jgi:hypothetical protein